MAVSLSVAAQGRRPSAAQGFERASTSQQQLEVRRAVAEAQRREAQARRQASEAERQQAEAKREAAQARRAAGEAHNRSEEARAAHPPNENAADEAFLAEQNSAKSERRDERPQLAGENRQSQSRGAD
jgi:hypothetical protein